MSKSEVSSAFDVLRALKTNPNPEKRKAALEALFTNWDVWIDQVRSITMLLGSKEVTWSSKELFRLLQKVTDKTQWPLYSKESDAKLLLRTVSKHLTVGSRSSDILSITEPKEAYLFCLFAKDFFEHKGGAHFQKIVVFLLGQKENLNEKNFRGVIQGAQLKVIVAAFNSVYCFDRERLSAIKGLLNSTDPAVKASALSVINADGLDDLLESDKENRVS